MDASAGDATHSAAGAKGIIVKKMSDSEVALSERALAGLIDPNDKEEQRIERMQQDVNDKFGDPSPKIAAMLLNRKIGGPSSF